MRIPETAPDPLTLFSQVATERLAQVYIKGLKAEVDGQYLHWDELRHRSPPAGFSHHEWWLGIGLARLSLKSPLPLNGKDGKPFQFARAADPIQRLLHQIDRDFGGQLEVSDPQLANRELRDRYLIRSLMEEAITSSQLEGASTTRKVAKELLLSGRRPRNRDERMIANNFKAIEFLRGKAKKPLSRALLLELHEIFTDGTLQPGEAGRLRKVDEQITVQDIGDGQVVHVPPNAGELPGRIEALCKFANEDSDAVFVHPIIRAIVLHFTLAYDHPFTDGNGRTARALFYWSMLRHGYWLAEFLSISRVIKKAPSQYGRAFLHSETDANDLTYFLVHQLDVIRVAFRDLRVYLERKAKELRESERLLKDGANFNHRQRALLADALRHPDRRYTIEAHRREHGVVYQTARQDLLDLAEAGYLQQRAIGRTFYFSVPSHLERLLKSKSA